MRSFLRSLKTFEVFEAQNYFRLIFGLQLVTKYHRSLSLILGLDVTVGILLRKDIFCCDFILCAVATFWSMSLVGIYPGRASNMVKSYSFNPL